jgi:hypothetical protein
VTVAEEGDLMAEDDRLKHDELLKRFQPVLRYDSNEQYFVDSAAQWTGCPGHELRRKDTAKGMKGKVIASAAAAAGKPQLTLEFLGRPKAYDNGEPWDDGDVISDPSKNYRAEYVRLRTEHPELNNVMYARSVEDNGRLWLQYWFWYFYNNYQLAFGAGLHEGDWEMVQLRMHPTEDRPDVAVYAQHRYGEKRSWGAVKKVGERPIVYVGRGSHASYFEKGFHQTEAWYDLADGKRKAPELAVEIVHDKTHEWMRWRGTWGDTKPSDHDKLGLQSNSPTGPGHKKQWSNPNAMLDDATETKLGKAQVAPDVTVVRHNGTLRVDYDFTKRNPRPIRLVVTVNSRDEKGVPPKTYNVEAFDPSGRGSAPTDIALDPAKHYDVYTSTVGGDPPKPSESTLEEIGTVGPEKPPSLPAKVATFFSGLIAKIRGDR